MVCAGEGLGSQTPTGSACCPREGLGGEGKGLLRAGHRGRASPTTPQGSRGRAWWSGKGLGPSASTQAKNWIHTPQEIGNA